jgi:hypothetical protein
VKKEEKEEGQKVSKREREGGK